MEKIRKYSEHGTRFLYCALLTAVMALLLFASQADYANKRVFLWTNAALLSAACVCADAVCLASAALKKRRKPVAARELSRRVRKVSFLLFVLECYVAYNIYFSTGWDADAVYQSALWLSGGPEAPVSQWYFSVYPNNLLLLSVETLLLRLNQALGLFEGQRLPMCLVVVNCALNAFSCHLVYATLRRLAPRNTGAALWGYGFAIALYGFSPWTVFPYSDALALLFPVLLLYIATYLTESRPWAVCVALGAIGAIGYEMKPTSVLLPAAVLAVYLLGRYGHPQQLGWLKRLGAVLLCLACFALTRAGLGMLYPTQAVHYNPDAGMGMAHYFMMGASERAGGTYDAEDVAASVACATPEERNLLGWSTGLERYREMGLAGTATHMAKKLLTVYNDGLFAWEKEGGFFQEVPDPPNALAAPLLRKLNDIQQQGGSLFAVRASLSQGIWLFVLLTALWAVRARREVHTGLFAAMLLSIAGITVFLMIFEARARYLYLYLPIYCVLAGLGFSALRRDAARIFAWLRGKVRRPQRAATPSA